MTRLLQRYPVTLSLVATLLLLGGFGSLKAGQIALCVLLFILAAMALTYRMVIAWRKGRALRSQREASSP